MKYRNCKILDCDDNVIVENVDVDTSGDRQKWEGSFVLPLGAVKSGDTCKLVLEDGRSADILVFSVQSESDKNTQLVKFKGQGLLK